MRGSACALLLALFSLPAAAKEPQARFIRAADADTVLQPGDVMMKTLGPKTKITRAERAIEGGQRLVKKLSADWFGALKVADVRLFHVAVYIGKGRTAEAHGGNVKTARVAIRSIDDHAGYLFHVYRPRDRELAKAAAKVAETWANGRMHYLVPWKVPLQRVNFGPAAKKEALAYGQAANTAGGPAGWDKMFCSQFAMAVFQGASVASDLKAKPGLKAEEVMAPIGADLQPSHASPLAVHSRLERAVKEGQWDYVGEVLVTD